MTVLVVGTDDWAIEQCALTLRAGGLHTVRCHAPGEPAFPCVALRPGGRCPVDEGIDVVVVARARPTPTPEVGEIGAVCALRSGRPLVVTGITRNSPFTPLAAEIVGEHGDLVAAVRLAHAGHRSRVVVDLPRERGVGTCP